MKGFVKIVVVSLTCSMITALTAEAVSLVGTRKEAGGVRFTRQVKGVRGGQPYESIPGGYPTQLRGDDGKLLNGGKWVMAFCVEPGRAAHSGKDGELRINTIPLEKKPGGLQAAWLMDNFYHSTMSKAQFAALQIAIWEVITDSSGDYDLSSGDFKIWGGEQKILDIAYSYLLSVPKRFDTEYLNHYYWMMDHPSKQDFLIQRCGGCCKSPGYAE
ncbi:hypothetical protein CSB45_14545 [candidate division KSB3 bacterium]|uniref:Thioester domain-containing protein n=1 Tax=candidate division KSB3 bacterium TaxID=2044937 RepID=A0A2G6E1X2_9BACT|nr:MAG: hypothetical protein CSB45_14545 [candidate division KSB3 bacterium]PIE28420.1 MAG: hypothetical protein CSA57_13985 [candidate division KSB3 bacterium]